MNKSPLEISNKDRIDLILCLLDIIVMQTLLIGTSKCDSAHRERRVGTMFDLGFEELQGKLRLIMEESTTLASGIRAWMLLSKEGLPISSAVPQGLEEAEIAAMAASILGVADLAAERLDQGALEEILMTNEKGLVIMKSAGEKAILVLAASKSIKTGLLVYAATTATEKIAPLL
jgi:predicted regulator of Ras-like GTPase activity (Roadblock/LC7/MglB family)